MDEIQLDGKYLVLESGTSDGTQDKYYKDGIWYKIDHFGGEGKNEAIISKLLSCTNIENYVTYQECIINEEPGCYSESFLKPGEEFVTLYRLHQNIKGSDIERILQQMDFDDQVHYVMDFTKKETGLDITQMLKETFFIDTLTFNEDRHMNNIGLIYDGKDFRPAPVFDNGKSFYCGNKKVDLSKTAKDNAKYIRFRPFTADANMLKRKFPLEVTFDWQRIKELLKECTPTQEDILKYTLQPYIQNELEID